MNDPRLGYLDNDISEQHLGQKQIHLEISEILKVSRTLKRPFAFAFPHQIVYEVSGKSKNLISESINQENTTSMDLSILETKIHTGLS